MNKFKNHYTGQVLWGGKALGEESQDLGSRPSSADCSLGDSEDVAYPPWTSVSSREPRGHKTAFCFPVRSEGNGKNMTLVRLYKL